MSEELPTYVDFHGFNDFAYFYPKPVIVWTIIGTILLIITIVSYIPQPIKIINKMSSYGLAPVSTFSSTICLWFVVFNVLCLKWEDFVGIFHHFNFYTYARFLTFANCFAQWFLMSQVPYLIMLFYDKEIRPGTDDGSIKKGWKEFRSVSIILMCIYIPCIFIWGLLGMYTGFTSTYIDYLGHISGIVGFIIEVLQFIPQIIKTFKMKSSGNLSVLMLEIQAPVNLGNAMFMCFGNNESWTTYAASIADGCWEFVLLAMCIYYNRVQKRGEGTDNSENEINLTENEVNEEDDGIKDVEKQPGSGIIDVEGNPDYVPD